MILVVRMAVNIIRMKPEKSSWLVLGERRDFVGSAHS